MLLSTLGCGGDPGPEAPATTPPDQVLARWNVADQAGEPMLPFQLEQQADVIALATTTAVTERGGREVLGLRLEETLKGATVAATLFPPDIQPWLGCIMPARIPRPSEMYPPGSAVLAYLTCDVAGQLQILSLQPRPATLAPLRRFLSLYEAARQLEPDWQQLWPPEPLGLDQACFYALGGNGTPLATVRAPLLERLELTVSRVTESAAAADPERLRLLVALVNHYRPPAALPALARLVDWTLSTPPHTLWSRYRGYLLPDGRLLAQASPEQAARWRDLLARVLQAESSDLFATQGACVGLAALPDELGFPLLISQLRAQRLEAANPLYHWLNEPRPPELVAELRDAVTTLLREADRSDERQLTFARHLETIAARLAQRGD